MVTTLAMLIRGHADNLHALETEIRELADAVEQASEPQGLPREALAAAVDAFVAAAGEDGFRPANVSSLFLHVAGKAAHAGYPIQGFPLTSAPTGHAPTTPELDGILDAAVTAYGGGSPVQAQRDAFAAAIAAALGGA
jgi:hypothetical protein